MNHVVESCGRVVPALDFSSQPSAMPCAPQVEGLSAGVSACGQPTVTRIHPRDGQTESFGIFATPALAAHFMKTFGGARS